MDLNYLHKELFDEIQFIKNELADIKNNKGCDEMWDNSDIIRNWKVSLRTLAEWRAERKIGYVQIGNKIWYPKAERESFIKANQVSIGLKNVCYGNQIDTIILMVIPLILNN
jgi:hypothetical protein